MSVIKELREMTGAGMLECKKALDECGHDLEKAARYLRDKGIASLAKRAGNKTGAGNFGFYENDTCACMIALLSETDFVSNNELFKKAADDIAAAVVKNGSYIDGSELKDIAPQSVLESISVLKENIKIGQVALMFKKPGQSIYHYMHNAGQNRCASMVLMSGPCDYGIGVAVHVTCNVPIPVAIRKEDVSDAAAHEEAKFTDETNIDKIKASLSILDAPFLMNSSKTVAEHLGDAHILEYIRIEITAE